MDFTDKIEKVGDCLMWYGDPTGSGYGRITLKGKRVPAHRYFYEREKGPIPQGMVPDHLCNQRACVNVKHLELVTPVENQRRAGKQRTKNHPNCAKGHPFSGENLYVRYYAKLNKYWRSCMTCRRETVRNSHANRKARQLNLPRKEF